MELKFNNKNEIQPIQFNFEEIKTEVTQKVEIYKNMVYTDETIKEAKNDRAKLNNFIKILEDERKRVKKECLRPYEDFEKQIKELVAIINEPVKLIDTQVKDFEDREREEKIEKIRLIWESKERPEWLKCGQIWNEKWLNKSTSLKKVEEEIDQRLTQIQSDIATIKALPDFSFEAMEFYQRTLELNGAIAEGQRLVTIQKAKEEQVRLQEEMKQKREAEEAEKMETPEPMPEPIELPRKWVRFAALVDAAQAKALADFCKNNGIKIEPIK